MNPNQKLSLSADVLRSLYALRETRVTLDDLCDALGVTEASAQNFEGVRVRAVRREDVRDMITSLDEQGFVDAMRMRLTLTGFTLATSLTTRRLVPLHLVA